MDSTLSDIFRTNDELNTVAFEITRLGVVRYALTQPEGTEDWRRTISFTPISSVGISVARLSLIMKVVSM
jgi:hypothetical protein